MGMSMQECFRRLHPFDLAMPQVFVLGLLLHKSLWWMAKLPITRVDTGEENLPAAREAQQLCQDEHSRSAHHTTYPIHRTPPQASVQFDSRVPLWLGASSRP